uniref:Peptidase A2 domain-containing protein n=1 Tax=Cyprinus carpio carpio TaxID=630221 RepID=A0A9J7YFX7_CYPCA
MCTSPCELELTTRGSNLPLLIGMQQVDPPNPPSEEAVSSILKTVLISLVAAVGSVGSIMLDPEEDSTPAASLNDRVLTGQGLASRMATAQPVFMPETFTGANREWSDWIGQFEIAAEVNGWDDSLKLKFLSLLLSGRARDIYCGLSTESRSSYVVLKASLGRCLEPCDSDDWNRASFLARRRQPNETAREFGNALLALCNQPSSGVYLNAKIGGSDVHLLLDMGAQASIIPKHVWLWLTEGGGVSIVRLYGGSLFLVADISTPDILQGMDFLLKYGVIIDLREQCCSVMGNVATITFWGIINSNEVNIHESMNMMCLLLTNIKLPKEGIFNHLKVTFIRINLSYLDNLFVPRTGC